MTISDEISIIANKLANDGKTPSVALIKSRLGQHAPLPKIIAVLKSWQHDPTFTSTKNVETISKDPTTLVASNKDIHLLIANALAPLQQEIAELTLQVNQLIEKQK